MTIIERCRHLACMSEDPVVLTRTFLSPPVRDVHRSLCQWMTAAGMSVSTDAAGNLRGRYPGLDPSAPRLLIGSHIDTVPDAGAYDGPLGVMLGIALVESLAGRRLRFGIEVIAFSEEEGVRFGVPFIGSRALTGDIDSELLGTIEPALRDFGLDPEKLPAAAIQPNEFGAYLEFHIEQGPVLESLSLPLGVVTAIAGQSRLAVVFRGKANHAGTTPMHLRRDALAAAAQWIVSVEQEAVGTPHLVATVGSLEALPGAGNVIAGEVRMSLDVRHAEDEIRRAALSRILAGARAIGAQRDIGIDWSLRLDQASVACDAGLVARLGQAVATTGLPVHRMVSGAGHDAMVMARKVPAVMLFLRSPGGISHHPDESVLPEDVDAALRVGMEFLRELEARDA
ncbi:MAG: allantoate amidohydrolase [Bryobacteraceae bacterium]